MASEQNIRVTAIIPIHNGMPHVTGCIESLLECSSGGRITMRIIVVDDGSTDGSSRIIRESFPNVDILSGDGSLWWTGAIDMGVREALKGGCNFLLWLNHDDRMSGTALQKLLQFSHANPDTIACCAVASLSDPEGSMLLGFRVHYCPLRWYLENIHSTAKDHASPVELDLNGGHGILIPSALFANPGNHLRPKTFPHYFGDFDFFHRVRRNGWKVVSVPGAVILNDDRNSGIINGRRISKFSQSLSYITSRRSIANLRDRPLFALLDFPMGLNLLWAAIFLIIPIGCAIVYPALALIQNRRKRE